MTQSPSFQNRGTGRRTGRDRRATSERRRAERRLRMAAAATERRSGSDRRVAARRSGQLRRMVSDRRQQRFGFGPVGALGAIGADPAPTRPAARAATRQPTQNRNGEVSDRDRSRARRLPEEFLEASGSAIDRLNKLIRQSWPRHPLPVRAAVAEAVLPVLAPLLDAGATVVSNQVREDCEAAVLRGLRLKAH